MKNILFPTDFTPNSLHAMRYALYIARKTQAVITVFHVYTIPAANPYTISLDIQLLMEEFKSNSEVMMKRFEEDIVNKLDKNGLPEIIYKNEYGPITDTIISLANDIKADLIVMGTNGGTSAMEGLIGSTTSSVIEKASCPVFLVPFEASLNEIKSIIYAADLESSELSCINEIKNFAGIFESYIKVIHVKGQGSEKKSNEDMFQLLQHEFNNRIEFELIQSEDVRDGIENYVNINKPDVIAFAKKERGFWESLFHKSITKHFSHTSLIPILILHKTL